MQLWILEPTEDQWQHMPLRDITRKQIVRAVSEQEARAVAVDHAGDEGASMWASPARSTCGVLTADGNPGLICKDFAEGS